MLSPLCIILLVRNIFAVHPNFRLVGVGETHKSSSTGQQSGSPPSLASWITPELLSMFHFHHVKPLPMDQERQVIMRKVTVEGDGKHGKLS